jgi:hypothetical protein
MAVMQIYEYAVPQIAPAPPAALSSNPSLRAEPFAADPRA